MIVRHTGNGIGGYELKVNASRDHLDLDHNNDVNLPLQWENETHTYDLPNLSQNKIVAVSISSNVDIQASEYIQSVQLFDQNDNEIKNYAGHPYSMMSYFIIPHDGNYSLTVTPRSSFNNTAFKYDLHVYTLDRITEDMPFEKQNADGSQPATSRNFFFSAFPEYIGGTNTRELNGFSSENDYRESLNMGMLQRVSIASATNAMPAQSKSMSYIGEMQLGESNRYLAKAAINGNANIYTHHRSTYLQTMKYGILLHNTSDNQSIKIRLNKRTH